jgi:Mg2+ and Co2+ transporter CorA
MRIRVWRDGALSDSSLEELVVNHRKKLWFDVTDPSLDDMEKLATALKVPRNSLIGKLSSNYPHVDSYPEYTKVFAWYLNTKGLGKDITSDMAPVIAFTNGLSVVSVSRLWAGLSDKIAQSYESPRYTSLSHTARVIYLTLDYVLESYEYFVDSFETQAEKLEDQNPPWPRSAYMDAFVIRREASSLLRQLRHLKRLTEVLTDNHTELGINELEKRMFDGLYERATGAVETTEVTHETMQDLIGMHMDTLSHDLNKTMRLIAALTVIIGVPSLFSTLLGLNMTGAGSGTYPLAEITISILTMSFLGLFFYVRGWLSLD